MEDASSNLVAGINNVSDAKERVSAAAATVPAALQIDLLGDVEDQEQRSGETTPTSWRKQRLSTGRSKELHAHHREISLKLDLAREASATAGCTFQPLLSSKSRQKDRKFDGGDAFDHLYKDGERRREKLQQRQEEAAASAATFRPDTTATANSPFARKQAQAEAAAVASAAAAVESASNGPNAPPPPPAAPLSPSRRQEALYEDATARAERAKEASAAAYSALTFTPDTAATRRFNSSHLRARSAMPLFDRLYERERVAGRGEYLAAQKRAMELEDCTFSPRVRRLSAPPPGGVKSVHDRLFGDAGRIAEARGRRREQLAAESAAPCTFQPSLVARAKARLAAGISQSLSPPRSRTMAGGSGGGCGDTMERGDDAAAGASVFARLYRHAQEQGLRRTAAAAGAGTDPECTFRPTLPGAATAAHDTEQEGNRLEALYRHGKELQDRRLRSPQDPSSAIREREEAAELATACTFVPDTSFTEGSPYRKARKPRDAAEMQEDLYTGAMERKARAQAEALARAQEGTTFRPTLVSTSTSPTAARRREEGVSVFEELYADKAKVDAAQREAREKLQDTECTFKPTLVARPHSRSPTAAGGRCGPGAAGTAALPSNASGGGDAAAAGAVGGVPEALGAPLVGAVAP